MEYINNKYKTRIGYYGLTNKFKICGTFGEYKSFIYNECVHHAKNTRNKQKKTNIFVTFPPFLKIKTKHTTIVKYHNQH